MTECIQETIYFNENPAHLSNTNRNKGLQECSTFTECEKTLCIKTEKFDCDQEKIHEPMQNKEISTIGINKVLPLSIAKKISEAAAVKQEVEKSESCDDEYFEDNEEHPVDMKPKKKHICSYCKKEFAFKSALKKHLATHTGIRPFKCDTCDKSFAQFSQLVRHIKIHSGGIKEFKCEYCGREFWEASNYNIHLRIHSGEKPYSCDVCNKKFARKGDVILHIRKHTGEKPYKCDICNKTFSRSSNLNTHIQLHTGEKPFECKICSKTFARESYLMAHIRTHTGDKPFECIICKKSFAQPSHLSNHMKLHERNDFRKPICTTYCNEYIEKVEK